MSYTIKCHSILCWNVRSLFPHLEETERTVYQGDPEIIGLTETWLNNSTSNDMVMTDGVNIVRFDRTANSGKKGGGGILFYFKNSLKCQHLSDMNIWEPFVECMWLKLELPSTKPIYYGLVHRTPTGNVPMFIEKLESLCLELRPHSDCELNILEDLNLDFQNKSEIPEWGVI